MKDRSYEAYGIFFETLANQNRLHIINALRTGEKNVTEIIAITKLEQTCVSHCLARLEKCGFVTQRRNGKFKLYALNLETIEPLMQMIDKHTRKYCCHLLDTKHHANATTKTHKTNKATTKTPKTTKATTKNT